MVASVGLTACGDGKQTTNVTTVDTGQQLIDLQAALESGAITQEEYDKKQAEILKNG